jgi:hypothetical protein
MNAPAPALTTEEVVADYNRVMEAHLAMERDHQAAVAIVEAQGREDFGDETFNSMCQDFVDAVGKDQVVPLMRLITQTDAPTRVVAHLAENPDLAKRISKMPAGRAAAELGRVEAQLMPNGSGGGADLAWVSRAKGGNKRGLGDELSDAQWEKNFKAKFYTGGGLDGQKFLRR